MKTRHVLTAATAAMLLFTALLVSPAHAAVLTYTGTIEADGTPKMPVVTISGSSCTSQGVTEVTYREYPITATGDGTTSFDLTELEGNISMYLMEAGWDPAAALPFCLAGSNSTPPSFTFDVVAGTDYVVVVFDDSFDQEGGSYDLVIDGPVTGPYTEVTPPTRPPGSLPAPTTTAPPTTAPPTTAPPTTGTTPTTATPTTMPPTTGTTPTTATPTTPTTARPGGVAPAPPAQPMSGAPGYTG